MHNSFPYNTNQYNTNQYGRNLKKITLKGLFSSAVLGGNFNIVRGYAHIKDLVLISKSYNFDIKNQKGYQRDFLDNHAKEIKEYFESKKGSKFIPEIILGARIGKKTKSVIFKKGFNQEEIKNFIDPETNSLDKKTQSKEVEIQVIPELQDNEKNYFNRIDGNHRLFYAEKLKEDKTRPNQYIIPFCLILLGEKNNNDDDIAEALVFHNINFKGVKITSEHGLNVLLCHEEESRLFDEDPKIYATKIIKEKIEKLDNPDFENIFDNLILTRIFGLVDFMSRNNLFELKDKEAIKTQSKKIIKNVEKVFVWGKREELKICDYTKNVLISLIFLS